MFQSTPFYQVGADVVFGLMVPPILPSPSDQMYTVSLVNAQRLDKIAKLAFGDERYWWAIAMVNNIVDPQAAIPVGTILRIPPVSSVNSLQ